MIGDSILEIRNLCKSYGALVASKNLSLDLNVGEIHALIGPNGAGKSTLIGQIAGDIQSDSGSIHFLGKNISSKPTMKRARLGLGRTFQVSALAMENTVMENVILGALGQQGAVYSLSLIHI